MGGKIGESPGEKEEIVGKIGSEVFCFIGRSWQWVKVDIAGRVGWNGVLGANPRILELEADRFGRVEV